MLDELKKTLLAYSARTMSVQDFEAWLASVDWDEGGDLTYEQRELVASLELVATEVAEGLRSESELRAEVMGELAELRAIPNWMAMPSGTSVTSSSTSPPQPLSVFTTAVGSPIPS